MIKLQNLVNFVLMNLVFITIFGSCSIVSNSQLDRHDLFAIPLGTLPEELDWFYQGGAANIVDIQTRNGLVYISNSRRGKVMVFNSYGDLLTIVYDPSRNPIPSGGRDGEFNSSFSSWPFRSPRIIAAYNEGFFVGDSMENEPRERYEEGTAAFNRIVLRFDREGNYLEHLGREGPEGSPFPNILAIDVRYDDTVVVTCHPFDSETWFSYWYTEDGFPITAIQVREDRLPDIEEDRGVRVQAVRPDPKKWMLHLRVDVYDRAEPGRRVEPRLYTLNLSTLEYDEPIRLPYAEGLTDWGYPSTPPEYLGTMLSGNHAMLYREGPDTYRISVLNAQGSAIHNRHLEVSSSARIYRSFKIQNDGLLTGVFFGNSEATVSLWRLDKILKK